MSHIKEYKQFKLFDIDCALDASPDMDKEALNSNNLNCIVNKQTQNGFVIVSAQDHSDEQSKHAIKIIQNAIFSFFEKKTHKIPFIAIKQSILFANKKLYYHANQNELLKGKILSCLVILIHEKQIYYAYVGKNNLFLKQDDKLVRLTPGISQDENQELHETTYINSSIIDQNLNIRSIDKPILPDQNDKIVVCTNNYVNTSDDVVLEIINNKSGIQQEGIELTKWANENSEVELSAYNIIEFDLQGGRYTISGSLDYMYGNFINRVVDFITSTPVLIVLTIIIVIILLFYIF